MPLANKELNDTILRPRFNFTHNLSHTVVLSAFESTKTSQSDFLVSRVDNHVFIRQPKSEQQFSSPQLHLEILPLDEQHCTIKGLFGPNPTIWTLFMFLHFVIVMLFLGNSIWMYTNWNLNRPVIAQSVIYALLIIAWFTLYAIGQMNKKKNIPTMLNQHHFMRDTLRQAH
ncbi:MAG: GTP-binding protein [Flavobacteriaceae bacterium]